MSTPPLTSHERMVRDVVHGIGGCGAIESGRICIQNKGHAEPCFETTAEAENAKPRCHRTLGCARDREHGGACDPRTSDASSRFKAGDIVRGADQEYTLVERCHDVPEWRVMRGGKLLPGSLPEHHLVLTHRTKEASPEPKWETLYRQCVGQLSVLAGALGNTNGDPEVSLGMVRDMRSDLERGSVQAVRVGRAWEDDPTSLYTENAIRELTLRARTPEAVVWADEISPFNGAQVKALLEENERLRQGSETPNRCRGCKGILTQATHCNDCAPVTGGGEQP